MPRLVFYVDKSEGLVVFLAVMVPDLESWSKLWGAGMIDERVVFMLNLPPVAVLCMGELAS